MLKRIFLSKHETSVQPVSVEDAFWIVPSPPSSATWTLLQCSDEKIVCISCLPCVLHIRPSRLSWLYYCNIWWRVQIMKLFMMQLSSASCYLGLLGANVHFGAVFSNARSCRPAFTCSYPLRSEVFSCRAWTQTAIHTTEDKSCFSGWNFLGTES
jgi:hypothetical protein